jgi:8-oxo-dGTP pyrophosphatase MutT (NUDIX family)
MRIGGLNDDPIKEAGQQVAALCWRHVFSVNKSSVLEILLITSLRKRHWILPKGWPQAGLSLAQSAAREALEEAGVTGDVATTPLGRYNYLKEKKDGGSTPCRVDVFALHVRRQHRKWLEKGARQLLWLPAEQAAAKVTEPGLRRILLQFTKSIRAAA